MKVKFLAVFFIALTFSNAVFAAEKNTQVEIWNSAEGLKRLERSQFKNDFYQLVNFFQPQENPLYCSVATATIISNALDYGKIASQKNSETRKPQTAGGGIIEYRLYSQSTFFNDKTEKVKKRSIVEYREPKAGSTTYDPGFSLGDFATMLSKGHNLKAKVIYANKNDEESIEKFRQVLKKNLIENKFFVAVNFDGQVLEKTTRGHLSPVVAYDEESDSALVMDVALHKNQWYWAKVPKLFEAMNTKDDDIYRGYLVIGR